MKSHSCNDCDNSRRLACASYYTLALEPSFKSVTPAGIFQKISTSLCSNWIAQTQVSRSLRYIPKRIQEQNKYPSGLPKYSESDFFTDDPIVLPTQNSVLIEIHFMLTTPWYSRSEEKFAPIDNMCCKDYLTGLPMVRPTVWKGQIRTMLEQELLGLKNDFPAEKNLMERINALFGPNKDASDEIGKREGRLIFYPTYFDKIGGEVISPHDRKKGISLNTIYYEVVPKGTAGVLKILYFPFDIINSNDQTNTILSDLSFTLNKAQLLLEQYGFSAKKTIGWGLAKIDRIWLTPGSEIDRLVDNHNDSKNEEVSTGEPQTYEFSKIADVAKNIGGMEKR
jgi:CRISPR/Cas system CSM-associated protein Csm3 (group 7 of RAMP superfamily)